jgi:CRISPR-associated Csx2 family protein
MESKMEEKSNLAHRKVFISFLGTTDYKICNYYFDGDENDRVCNVRHVQEAIVSHECKGWSENDRILIFLTKAARANNWESGTYKPSDGQKIGDLIDEPANLKVGDAKWGLKEQLHKLAEQGFFPESIVKDEPLDSEGFSEDEIWNIFNTIESKIEENDEIYFDFTNGFRNLPMLGMVLLTYLKNTKNITIGEIYYGAFEKLGPAYKVNTLPMDKRNAPVLRLKSFNDIMDFSTAANVFIKYGNGKPLHSLMTEWATQNRSEKKEREFTRKLQELANTLKKLTDNFLTCRGAEICYESGTKDGSIFNQLQAWFENYDSTGYENKDFKALYPMIEKIREKYDVFDTRNSSRNGLKAAYWCFQNQMYQQSITLLQETIVTACVEKVGLHPDVEAERSVVEKKLKEGAEKGESKKLDSPRWLSELENLVASYESKLSEKNADADTLKDFLIDEVRLKSIKEKISEIPEELGSFMQTLTSIRNDMAHAGFLRTHPYVSGTEAKPASSIIGSLKSVFGSLNRISSLLS